jgi:hypothetical protein
MHDDEIRRQLMNYSRQYESVAAPPEDVIRRRLRRRQVRLAAITTSAATLVAVGAVAAAAAVLPAARHHGPTDKSRHTQKLGWQPAGPELPASAKPEAAPYVVSLGKGRLRGWSLTVLNWRTGAVLGHVRRPGGRCFDNVSGAADDRTFFLSVISCRAGSKINIYELRLSASGRPEPLIPINLPSFHPADTTYALSPDGTHLAYAAAVYKPNQLPNSSTITLYNLMTGTKRIWHGPGLVVTMAWAGDHNMAFELGWNGTAKPSIAVGLRLMNITVKSKSYTASRVLRRFGEGTPLAALAAVAPLPAAQGVLYGAPEIEVPGGHISKIVRYSARTGKPEFTFKPWVLIGRNYLWCDPLWTDGTGQHVLAACGSESSLYYLRIDGNRMRQVNLHFPLENGAQSANPYSFAF